MPDPILPARGVCPLSEAVKRVHLLDRGEGHAPHDPNAPERKCQKYEVYTVRDIPAKTAILNNRLDRFETR